jgi:glutathione S-transferase
MHDSMITVHHLQASRSQRVLCLLEELGLPYELKIYKRNPLTKLAPPELKQIHPLGKSPVITDGDLVVAESAAIVEYQVELVFMTIPTQPMPFFVKPIAREICKKVQKQLIDPNLHTSMAFIEGHLGKHKWLAGDRFTLADFQMSFAVSALMSRADEARQCPNLSAYLKRMEARPAYQRALAKGGPVLMG